MERSVKARHRISGKDPTAMLARVEARLRGEGSEGTA